MNEEKKHAFYVKWKDMNPGVKALIIAGCIVLFAGLLVLVGFIVMWLWNWLMPKLFGLPAIDYLEAWGIIILSQLLFKGFHGGRHVAERSRKRRLRESIREMEKEQEG